MTQPRPALPGMGSREARDPSATLRFQRTAGNQAVTQLLQRAARGATSASAQAPRSVLDTLRAPGRPLASATRSSMEAQFNQDFTDVRIHTDEKAAASAAEVQALAYTVGRHIVFAGRQYRPEVGSGRHLLTHELAHVVQQRGAAAHSSALRIAEVDHPSERQARRAARGVSGLAPVEARVRGQAQRAPWLARQEAPATRGFFVQPPPPVRIQRAATCWAAAIASRRSQTTGEPVFAAEVIEENQGRVAHDGSVSDDTGRQILRDEGLTLEEVAGADLTNRFIWKRLGGISGLKRPFIVVGLRFHGMAHVAVVYGVDRTHLHSMDPLSGYARQRLVGINPDYPFLVAS